MIKGDGDDRALRGEGTEMRRRERTGNETGREMRRKKRGRREKEQKLKENKV